MLDHGIRGSHLGVEVRWQCFSSSETLHEKGFPVRVLMLYACTGRKHKQSAPAIPGHRRSRAALSESSAHGSLFGGTRGLPLEAHHPTGCTSGIQRLDQKSLLVSLSKPSYRRRALNPARQETQQSLKQHPFKAHFHPTISHQQERSAQLSQNRRCHF